MQTPKEIEQSIKDYFYPKKLSEDWLFAATQVAWWTFLLSDLDNIETNLTSMLTTSNDASVEYIWDIMKNKVN